MEIKNTSIPELKQLLKAKEKQYHEAVQNNFEYDKIKHLEQSIRELKALIGKKKK
jgi:hypothetical protein